MTNIPVYLYPQEYAAENGELDKYRLSRKLNLACKEAIEQAIGAHYSEHRLDTSAAVKQVADAFGDRGGNRHCPCCWDAVLVSY